MRPQILLIPGNMCDERLWSGGQGLLRSALSAKGWTCGDADTTHDDSIAGMAARALSASDVPLIPVGFSMGAIVALEMMRQAPKRIAGLALFGLNAGSDLPERSAARHRQQAEVRAGGLERVIVEELKPNYLARVHRRDTELLALLLDMGLSLGDEVFVAQSEALRLRADLRPVLSAAAVPILLGCGEEDALCPPSWHQKWRALADDAELCIFRRVGHMLPLEAPEAFTAALCGWLDNRMTTS